MKTWRDCDHERTIENARRGRFKYGCRLCAEEIDRRPRFIDRALKTALKQKLHPQYGINNKPFGRRVIRILEKQDPIDRAAYLLLVGHRFDPAEVIARLGADAPERAERVKRKIAASEHQNFYKDWPLVQQLIDEGVPESEVREMIGITLNGWFKAKQRGDVRV